MGDRLRSEARAWREASAPEFSRPELCAPTRVELHEVLPALVKSYRRLYPTISPSSRAPIRTSASLDEGHLNQVLLNIVLNARDAMPTGGTLTLTAGFSPRAALPPAITGFDIGAVEIVVTDTGTGMDEETRSRAFEPFSTTKDTRGTGLGLSTAYGVGQQARGAIDLLSQPAKATTVRLFFPPLMALADTRHFVELHRQSRPPVRPCCWPKTIQACASPLRERSDRPAISSSRWAMWKPDVSLSASAARTSPSW
jgi:signal transduction histidine kinase